MSFWRHALVHNPLIFVSWMQSHNAGTTKCLPFAQKMCPTKYCNITALLDVILETGVSTQSLDICFLNAVKQCWHNKIFDVIITYISQSTFCDITAWLDVILDTDVQISWYLSPKRCETIVGEHTFWYSGYNEFKKVLWHHNSIRGRPLEIQGG